MKFRQLLRLDPSAIRKLLAQTDNKKERSWLHLAVFTRALLIVIFAIAFISLLTMFFGAENSSMAVSIFCILLATRYVSYSYNINDALINMFVCFIILTVCPVLASMTGILLKAVIYTLSLMGMLVMVCHDPRMGNGGLYTFAFVFLCGNPVSGQAFVDRCWMALTGYAICAFLMWHNHRNKDRDVRFSQILKHFTLRDPVVQWQLRLALGCGLFLTLLSSLHIEKFMWAGFACGSLLSDANVNDAIHEKFWNRLLGALLGCLAFYILYTFIPAQYHALFGPIGGLLLGLCVEYRHKTMLNCLGALMSTVPIYGLQGAVLLRIGNTILGIVAAIAFYLLYDRFVLKGLLKKRDDPIASSFLQ